MPYTNGQLVNTGCVAEGSRGWYAGQRVIEEAQGLGWELDAEGQEAVDRYYTSAWDSEDPADATFEIVVGQGGIVDEAAQWLNDNTPPTCPNCGQPAEPSEGQFGTSVGFWRHVNGQGSCIYRLFDHVLSYVWYWHDGEFFLSPICDDEEECSDDECAHWS